MKATEFEKACQALVGSERGWKVKAAELLGTTRPTLDAALSKGPSQALIGKLDAASAGVSTRGVEEGDLSEIRWCVGEPSDKLRDSKVLGEVVVTHVGFPLFILHAKWSVGKVMTDGVARADIEFRARWIDKPNSRDRKAVLLEQAKARATERLHASAAAYAESELRSKLERHAMTESGLSRDDVAAMTEAGLQVAKYASRPDSLEDAYEDLGRQRRELQVERSKLNAECQRAFDIGVKCGRLDQQERLYISAWAHAGAEVTQAFVAQPYRHLPFAKKETSRGSHDADAERDFKEMAALDWGDDE